MIIEPEITHEFKTFSAGEAQCEVIGTLPCVLHGKSVRFVSDLENPQKFVYLFVVLWRRGVAGILDFIVTDCMEWVPAGVYDVEHNQMIDSSAQDDLVLSDSINPVILEHFNAWFIDQDSNLVASFMRNYVVFASALTNHKLLCTNYRCEGGSMTIL